MCYLTSGVQDTMLTFPFIAACAFLYQKTCKKVRKKCFFLPKIGVFFGSIFILELKCKTKNCATQQVERRTHRSCFHLYLHVPFCINKQVKKWEKVFFSLKMQFFSLILILKLRCKSKRCLFGHKNLAYSEHALNSLIRTTEIPRTFRESC